MADINQEDYRLGILRYSLQHEQYCQTLMSEKGLASELITEFRYIAVMSKDGPLSAMDEITYADLSRYTEIAHGDTYVPFLSMAEVKKVELPDSDHCRICVFERASQFELLSKNHNTYMWVSAIPQDLLDRYDLVQRVVPENRRIYKDVLVYRQDYRLSPLDKLFIEELSKAKERVFG